mmetsp:Transcript_3797/g.7837  ORF Transcript_3797/g.7837 Transcript_3797/m.7837 type:complete len:108 (+) Transcript_3797:490-813(+)
MTYSFIHQPKFLGTACVATALMHAGSMEFSWTRRDDPFPSLPLPVQRAPAFNAHSFPHVRLHFKEKGKTERREDTPRASPTPYTPFCCPVTFRLHSKGAEAALRELR